MMIPIDTNIFPYKKGVYIVGGSIRDLLCGRTPYDYDLAVQDNPGRFAKLLASRTFGQVVEIGKPGQIIRRVISQDIIFDILPVNGTTIEEDLRQRDFTINAIALELASGNLIDQLGGRLDLTAKKIRMISSQVFRKDPARLIRAYRLAAHFNFTIEAETEATIFRDAYFIRRSAGERIREEFFKILQHPDACRYLSQMAQSGLLFAVFPELQALKNYRMAPDRTNDLFERTLLSCHHLEACLNSTDQTISPIGKRLLADIDPTRALLLKWAVLLQDIGKPVASRQTAGDTFQFWSHAANSAGMAASVCQRLRFSKRQTVAIVFLIRHHPRPLLLFRAQQKKLSMHRAFIRLFTQCRARTPDVLVHALAKFKGSRETGEITPPMFGDFILKSIQNYYSVLQPTASLPPLINGNDLIHEFGLAPSPAFKRFLRRVEEERLLNRAMTREKAIEFVAKLLNRPSSHSSS